MSRQQLLNRLERVERKMGHNEDLPNGIFIAVLDEAGKSQEVIGWQEMSRTDPITVMREEGEEDQVLDDRAADIVRAQRGHRSIPVMIGIYEEG